MAAPAAAELVDVDGLTARERVFCLAYIGHGFKNAAAAYRAVSPAATESTCRSEGSRWLWRPHVRRFIDGHLHAHFSQLSIDANEVLGRVAQNVRADVRDLYDADGRMLPPHRWPDSIATNIESFEALPRGRYKVKLASKAAARRLLLEVSGRLKNPVNDQVSVLARAIRSSFGEAVAAGTADPNDPHVGAALGPKP